MRLSLFGIVGSVFGAIGVLVTLQQRGLVFPTTIVEIVTIIIGVLLGLAVPSLIRLRAVHRINRERAGGRSAAG